MNDCICYDVALFKYWFHVDRMRGISGLRWIKSETHSILRDCKFWIRCSMITLHTNAKTGTLAQQFSAPGPTSPANVTVDAPISAYRNSRNANVCCEVPPSSAINHCLKWPKDPWRFRYVRTAPPSIERKLGLWPSTPSRSYVEEAAGVCLVRARRRPKEYRRKVDAASWWSGVRPHNWSDLEEKWAGCARKSSRGGEACTIHRVDHSPANHVENMNFAVLEWAIQKLRNTGEGMVVRAITWPGKTKRVS